VAPVISPRGAHVLGVHVSTAAADVSSYARESPQRYVAEALKWLSSQAIVHSLPYAPARAPCRNQKASLFHWSSQVQQGESHPFFIANGSFRPIPSATQVVVLPAGPARAGHVMGAQAVISVWPS
jgi:hypothetical protein